MFGSIAHRFQWVLGGGTDGVQRGFILAFLL